MIGNHKPFNTKKYEKLKRSAEHEKEIVAACKKHLSDSRERILSEKRKLESNLEILYNRLCEAEDNGETQENLDSLATDYEDCKQSIAGKQSSFEVLESAYVSIVNLYNLTVQCMDQGLYKIVIKSIPEKKLPALLKVDTTDALFEISYITEGIMATLKKRYFEAIEARNKLRDAQMKFTTTMAVGQELKGENSSYTSFKDDRRRREMKTTAATPVDIRTITANAKGDSKNKAENINA